MSIYATPWGVADGGVVFLMCILFSIFCWIYLGFIWPIMTMKDKTKTSGQRGFAGLIFVLVGLGPILGGLYSIWGAKGNANSSVTGGNKPGNAGGAPNAPSNVAGASNELAPKPNAPPAANVKPPNVAPAA